MCSFLGHYCQKYQSDLIHNILLSLFIRNKEMYYLYIIYVNWNLIFNITLRARDKNIIITFSFLKIKLQLWLYLLNTGYNMLLFIFWKYGTFIITSLLIMIVKNMRILTLIIHYKLIFVFWEFKYLALHIPMIVKDLTIFNN